MQIIDIQNHIPFQKKIGIVNQPAAPLRKGDALEILNKYHDPTEVGNYVYAARLLTSTNPQVIAKGLNSIKLIACYKVDTVSDN